MLPTIYTWLKTAGVQAIVGTPPRVYRHADAPQDVTKPYITWVMVSGVPDNELSSLPPSDRWTIQIDCWHQTDAGVEDLAKEVRDAIEPYGHLTSMPINGKEFDTKLYRIALQFDILQARS